MQGSLDLKLNMKKTSIHTSTPIRNKPNGVHFVHPRRDTNHSTNSSDLP